MYMHATLTLRGGSGLRPRTPKFSSGISAIGVRGTLVSHWTPTQDSEVLEGDFGNRSPPDSGFYNTKRMESDASRSHLEPVEHDQPQTKNQIRILVRLLFQVGLFKSNHGLETV